MRKLGWNRKNQPVGRTTMTLTMKKAVPLKSMKKKVLRPSVIGRRTRFARLADERRRSI
jgi:hypothetical protein